LGVGINDRFSIVYAGGFHDHDHDGDHRHGFGGGWWGTQGRPPAPIPRPGMRLPPPGSRIAAAAIAAPPPGHVDDGHGREFAHTPPPSIYARVPKARLPEGTAAQETRASVIRERPEQIFAEPDGTVVRRGSDGTWQERRNGSWGTIDFQNRPAAPAHAEPAHPGAPAGENRPAEPRPVEPHPVEQRPVEPHPVEPRPAEPRPVEPRPAEPRPVEPPPTAPVHEEPPVREPAPVGPIHAETPQAPATPTARPGPAFPTVPQRELELNRAFDERQRGDFRNTPTPSFAPAPAPHAEPQRGGDPGRRDH
jgi:hypothetical protein